MGRVTAPTFLLLLRVAAVTMPGGKYHAGKGIKPKCDANYESKTNVHCEDTRKDSSDY